MNETENRITPITRNDIAFNRRHLYESDKVKIGKKTFLVTSVFPIEIENGDTPSADEKIKNLLGWDPKFSNVADVIKDAWHWHTSHPDGFSSK